MSGLTLSMFTLVPSNYVPAWACTCAPCQCSFCKGWTCLRQGVESARGPHRVLYSEIPLNLCKHSSQEFSRGDFTPHIAASGLSGKMGHFLGVISCLGFFLAILPRQTGPGGVGRRHICGPGSYMSLLTEHCPVPSRGQGAAKSPSPGTLWGDGSLNPRRVDTGCYSRV